VIRAPHRDRGDADLRQCRIGREHRLSTLGTGEFDREGESESEESELDIDGI
jgi:hypothetical protein